MRYLYDLFFLIFAVGYVPVLLFKNKFHREFQQKLGKVPDQVCRVKRPVWIHAVSVGEAVVAARLCDEIKSSLPGVPVVISTTTSTGNEMAKRAAKNADAVFYYPLDLRAVVSRVLDKVDPSVYVIVETELWPNMLAEASSRSIPVILANGRISDSSYKNYRRIGVVTHSMLSCFSSLCMQTPGDEERMIALGCARSAVKVTGNVKFDTVTSGDISPEVEKVRDIFCAGKKVIVAGSTHYPEESRMIDAFSGLRKKSAEIKLIIAPRHIERKEAIKIYVERAGFGCCLFSDIIKESAGKNTEADVMIVDTIGHLKDIYSVATLAFIGGSLVKRGGQNPIEAARWGKAVIFGPNMSNFREIARTFVESGAASILKDTLCLEQVMWNIMSDDHRREKMERNAMDVISKNSGAVAKTVEVIKKFIY